MSTIVWDSAPDRLFDSGLDRGVLYPPSGPAVPWNGLTSIVEKFDEDRQPIYYDGRKINDLIVLGDFEATMRAVTFPKEFTELEGMSQAIPGMFLANQKPQTFGLTYRTKIGNAIGEDVGYKIHILYNITAVPSDRTYSTITDIPSITEFEWEITGIPEEVPGFRPTAHIIIDSTDLDPVLVAAIEDALYGTSSTDPMLLSVPELTLYLLSWAAVVLIDNGDGTYTAYSSQPGVITFPSSGEFAIDPIPGAYLDADTYTITYTP